MANAQIFGEIYVEIKKKTLLGVSISGLNGFYR
jgi:hypothetical protein